jgi:transcriptional antiterminator NusG
LAEEAKWYVVHTYSGYENKVADSIMNAVEHRKLYDLIRAVRVPTEQVIEIVEKKSKDGTVEQVEKAVERKIFPSYVFVKMIVNNDSWYIVRNTRGVTGFVGPGSQPVPLTKDEIARFRVEEEEGPVRTTAAELGFAVGDSVMVTGGAMENSIGTVETIDTDRRIVGIRVPMMGKDVLVELDLAQVAPI